ncbi:MAG: hypothetical protein QOH71_2685 [Blastocatellia bacterium]|nr:hypothetical protein [Blastocatellia bacterium]
MCALAPGSAMRSRYWKKYLSIKECALSKCRSKLSLAMIADTHCLPNESEPSAASVWQTPGPVNDDICEAWSRLYAHKQR